MVVVLSLERLHSGEEVSKRNRIGEIFRPHAEEQKRLSKGHRRDHGDALVNYVSCMCVQSNVVQMAVVLDADSLIVDAIFSG